MHQYMDYCSNNRAKNSLAEVGSIEYPLFTDAIIESNRIINLTCKIVLIQFLMQLLILIDSIIDSIIDSLKECRKKVEGILSREQILTILSDRLGNGKWALAILKKENRPLNKELLGELVNESYQQQARDGKKLLGSRHMLDEMAARLEGAGLVDVSEVGRARLYQLSQLGEELILHIQSQKS